MSDLPFAPEHPVTALRRAMFAHGFQPVPVMTRQKRPINDGWPSIRGVPPLSRVTLNTGINCATLRAIDIDIDDAEAARTAVALAMECLGATPLVRFRADSPRRLLVYRGSGPKRIVKTKAGKVEILGLGQQFVAFGVHPDGAAFEWEGPDPGEFALDDLPEVAPDAEQTLADALVEALGKNENDRGNQPQTPAPQPTAPVSPPGENHAATLHRLPNQDARIEAYVARALDEERANVRNAPKGHGNATLNTAALKLGQLVGAGWIDEASVFNSLLVEAVPRRTRAEAAATIRSGLTAGKAQPRQALEDRDLYPVPVAVVEAAQAMAGAKPAAPPSLIVTLGEGVDWTRPAGLLAEIADWILATSPMPNRPLAVAAATAVISTICGRHLYSASGTAMNVYIAMLAKTGVGKDRPLHAPAEILHAAGFGPLSRSGKAFAVSGLENMVVEAPCCLATTDELGTNLLSRISHKRASTHEQAIKGTLLELWSRTIGKAPFLTTQRAQASSVAVHSPSYTLFGASTPDQFYKALEGGDVVNGFMNRFLIADAAPRSDEDEDIELTPVPQVIVDCLASLVPELRGNLGLLGVFSTAGAVEERKLGWGPGAREAARGFKAQVNSIVAESPLGELWGRTYEYAIRLGGIHAVSRAGSRAQLEIGDLAWGAAWATQSARTMADAAENLMTRSDYEVKLNDVKKVIKKAGTITRSDLLRTIRHLDARDMESVTNHLAEAGFVDKLEIRPEGAGRPARAYRWKG